MLLLTGRTWGQLKILCIPVSRFKSVMRLCVSFKSAAQMPFKYVTSILTTYFPVAQQKKDIDLKCEGMFIFMSFIIYQLFWMALKLDGIYVWKIGILFFWCYNKEIGKFQAAIWQFSTLYHSAFLFALYFKAYALEALEI